MKNRHPLLIYRARSRTISRPILIVIFLMLLVLATNQFFMRFIPWGAGLLIGIGIALFIGWAGFTFFVRQSAIYIKRHYLLIQGPWQSFTIQYDQIRGVIPTRLSEHYPAEEISANELQWLGQLYDKPCALIQTYHPLLQSEPKKKWFNRLLFTPKDRGIVCIVSDWVALVSAVEEARSYWIRQQTETPKSKPEIVSSDNPRQTNLDTAVAGQQASLVLIITSNPAQQTQLQKLLAFRYRLKFATSGVQGLRLARDTRPHLILSDVKLPNMNGLQMLKAIRKSERIQHIPILFLGENVNSPAAVAVLKNGANDFIARPYTDENIQLRLNLWLKQTSNVRRLKNRNNDLRNKTLSQMAELVRRGELINFLPQAVAQNVMSGEINSHTQPLKRLNATVLFIDIVGFTTLTAKLDPAILAEILNEYLREMTAIAIAHRGTVDKFIGDAVMVLFGAPEEQDEAEQVWNAARTAFQMRKVVDEMNMIWRSRLPNDLEVRIGFNTGICTAGVFGNEVLRSYTVVGRGVNIAARLQSVAKPGQIVCSADSFRWLTGRVINQPLGKVKLKGVPHPVEACSLEELITPQHIREESDNIH